MLTAIVPCYNFGDYLAETLPNTVTFTDRSFVITGADDKKTIDTCNRFRAQPILTNKMHQCAPRIVFDKSAVVNVGLDQVRSLDTWVVLLDADTKLTVDFRSVLPTLDKNTMYGVQRLIYTTKKKYDSKEALQGEECAMGYFQLFHSQSNVFKAGARYRERIGLKGPDKQFADNWPVKMLTNLDGSKIVVEHLGMFSVNWHGRVSPEWQST